MIGSVGSSGVVVLDGGRVVGSTPGGKVTLEIEKNI